MCFEPHWAHHPIALRGSIAWGVVDVFRPQTASAMVRVAIADNLRSTAKTIKVLSPPGEMIRHPFRVPRRGLIVKAPSYEVRAGLPG